MQVNEWHVACVILCNIRIDKTYAKGVYILRVRVKDGFKVFA